ncbi:MAG TPA: DUF6519 domain-containing protein, partial [Blastocatellia bacterium]|nr:DUF6519 domain-containing protein [Blastocatellia bacterium]
MTGDYSRLTFDPKKHYRGVLMQQGRVQVDADWNEQEAISRRRIEVETGDIIGLCGAPENDAGFEIVATPEGDDLSIGAGRYYVDGILCENEQSTTYTNQPDRPGTKDASPVSLFNLSNVIMAREVGLVYLDVWKRHITALEDPHIREVALGGPDTATRIKTVWQVKVIKVSADPDLPKCYGEFTEWTKATQSLSGTLTARTTPVDDLDNPCLIPATAGYQRLENQLYRVEIHNPGPLGTATFKWSRDNGTVVTAIEKINGQQITVSDTGRDAELGFATGQWVEILDDANELSGLPGELRLISDVQHAA